MIIVLRPYVILFSSSSFYKCLSVSAFPFADFFQISFIFLTGICHGNELTNPNNKSQLSRVINYLSPRSSNVCFCPHTHKHTTKSILDSLQQNDYKIKPGCCCFISTFPFYFKASWLDLFQGLIFCFPPLFSILLGLLTAWCCGTNSKVA